MSEKNKDNYLKISFTLEEIKPILFKNINDAHNSDLALSVCTKYCIWHEPLIEYYKKNKKIQPSMSDKLAFIILLSYPKNVLEGFNTIYDIELFHEDSKDFIYKEDLCHEEDGTFEFDCICSYKNLHIINIVENKYSGIKLQVGSECITKHNLISKEEMKKLKETEKILKEHRKEIKEGKPIGYYKEEKKRIKEERERLKEENKNKKIQEKIKTGNDKICYYCRINIVCIKTNKLCICDKCKNKNYENLNMDIQQYQINECENCNNKCIDFKTNYPYLCKTCKVQYKIIKCKLCYNVELIVDINNNIANYCDECETKLIKCIDCKTTFIQIQNENRCNLCQYNYENKSIPKKCIRCQELMIIKEKESWRIYCKTCYKETQDIIKENPKCKCDEYMVKRTIKREGINKGRMCLRCSNYPNGCNVFKML